MKGDVLSGSSQMNPSRLGGFLRQLPWALAAMTNELLRFRFDFPIELVRDALKPGTLHYYVYSDTLFLDHLGCDENGVAVRTYRAQGRQYNPVFIAWWGLMNLERYLRESDPKCLESFHVQVQWLKANAVTRSDGTVVWPNNFDWQEGHCRLKGPWISAMSQGLAMSVLVRAYRLTKDVGLLSLCEQSARVFERSVEDGGVRTQEKSGVLYEEYPGYPLARVLDGFLFSLLGLYDLAQELQSDTIRQLFDKGIDGLKLRLADWDYRRKWTWYGAHGYLCPPHYHRLNGTLVQVLSHLAEDSVLARCGEDWNRRQLSLFDKAEVFLVFAFTKNLSRLLLPRN